jgi:hypothetical protein
LGYRRSVSHGEELTVMENAAWHAGCLENWEAAQAEIPACWADPFINRRQTASGDAAPGLAAAPVPAEKVPLLMNQPAVSIRSPGFWQLTSGWWLNKGSAAIVRLIWMKFRAVAGGVLCRKGAD